MKVKTVCRKCGSDEYEKDHDDLSCFLDQARNEDAGVSFACFRCEAEIMACCICVSTEGVHEDNERVEE